MGFSRTDQGWNLHSEELKINRWFVSVPWRGVRQEVDCRFLFDSGLFDLDREPQWMIACWRRCGGVWCRRGSRRTTRARCSTAPLTVAARACWRRNLIRYDVRFWHELMQQIYKQSSCFSTCWLYYKHVFIVFFFFLNNGMFVRSLFILCPRTLCWRGSVVSFSPTASTSGGGSRKASSLSLSISPRARQISRTRRRESWKVMNRVKG